VLWRSSARSRGRPQTPSTDDPVMGGQRIIGARLQHRPDNGGYFACPGSATAQSVTAGLHPSAPEWPTLDIARRPAREAGRNAKCWHLRAPAVMLGSWKFPRIGEISRACGFKSRTHKFPISACFRACCIVTRAQAPASARRSAFLAFPSFLVRALQPALVCLHGGGLGSLGARACRAAAAGFQVRVISRARR
jgi:hypothetical protein